MERVYTSRVRFEESHQVYASARPNHIKRDRDMRCRQVDHTAPDGYNDNIRIGRLP